MKSNIWHFAKSFSQIFEIFEPILEIGSLQIPEQESISNIRVFFKEKKYIGCDIQMGTGVDIVADAHNLPFPDNSVGTVILLETLEHIENPIKVMEEVYRVLRGDGVVVMSSAMNFNIHNYPSDYWRFTPQGFALLLKNFSIRIFGSQGNLANPHTVLGIGIKNSVSEKNLEIFKNFCETFSRELRYSVHTFDESLMFWYYIDTTLKYTFEQRKIVGFSKANINRLYLSICKIYNLYIMRVPFFRWILKRIYRILLGAGILSPYDK